MTLKRYEKIKLPNGMSEIISVGTVDISEDTYNDMLLISDPTEMLMEQFNQEKDIVRRSYDMSKERLKFQSKEIILKLSTGFGFFALIFTVLAYLTHHELAWYLSGFWFISGMLSVSIHVFDYIRRSNKLKDKYESKMEEVRNRYMM